MIRALAPGDLAPVAAIDAELGGRPRRAYFERRLAAAAKAPEQHLQLAVEADGRMAGFVLGRVLEGEFGRSDPEARLEVIGVARGARGRGLGGELAEAFEKGARRHGVRAVHTLAAWRSHPLLAFLDRQGFALAPAQVLERATAEDLSPLARDEVETQVLREADIDGIARIDQRHTGRQRRGFLCRALGEALADSAVRVSLAARIDGSVAGFVMARMDYGDFGRAEPAAVIDTIGVDPLRARQGIGRALLSQLLLNLHGLGVERLETVVAAGGQTLAAFFYAAGFRPSERLAFVKPLA